MKFVLAAVAALTASSVAAADLGIMGLTAGGETVAEYNMDSESMTLTVEPEIGKTWMDIDFTASSIIDIYNDEFVLGDTMPTLDVEARKTLVGNIEIYAGTGYDLELEERTDIKVGLSFSF